MTYHLWRVREWINSVGNATVRRWGLTRPQPRDCHLVNSTVKHWNTYKCVLRLKFVHIPYHTSRSMWVRVWFFMAHMMILESMSDHQVYTATSHQLARSSNVSLFFLRFSKDNLPYFTYIHLATTATSHLIELHCDWQLHASTQLVVTMQLFIQATRCWWRS